MANIEALQWEVLPFTKQMDEMAQLMMIERLQVEAHTDSLVVTPYIVRQDNTITLSGFSTSDWDNVVVEINRLGPLVGLLLQGSFSTGRIRLTNVDIVVRMLDLGVNIVPLGARTVFPGRTTKPETSLIWDINPFALPEDARFLNPVLRRLWVDIETGTETVTPVLTFNDGTTSTLSGITNASRAVTEFSLITSQRLKQVRLDGDFKSEEIILHDIEVDMYIPPRRRHAVG